MKRNWHFRLPRPDIHLLLVLLLSLFAIGPFLQPGYFWGAHDARHDVYFLLEYDRSVADGIWFPRWSPDFAFGYGYPFFVIYGPLSAFVGELIHHFLGLGFEATVKLLFALSILVSGWGMYGFVRSWLGKNAALVAALAYVYVPYHLVDMYVRAALAESVALAFLPLVLWAARSVTTRPSPARILGLALAYAGLMFTSNLVTLLFTPLLALYLALLVLDRLNAGLSWRRWLRQPWSVARALLRVGLPPALALLLGLGLSAAFWLPALIEGQLVNQKQWYGGYYEPYKHFVFPFQLFSPEWGFGISLPGPDEVTQGGMSFQLGAVLVVLAILSLWAARLLDPQRRREVRFFQLWLVGILFLTLPISVAVWERVPGVAFAQFPWRYLMLTAVPLAVLAGVTMPNSDSTEKRFSSPSSGDEKRPADGPQSSFFSGINSRFPIPYPLFAILLAALVILSSYPYLRVEMREPTPEQGPPSLAALMRFQRSANEMTGVTKWVQEIPRWSPMAELYVQGKDVTTKVDYGAIPKGKVLGVHSLEMGSAHEKVIYYAANDQQRIIFNIFYFPGWTAYILNRDSEEVEQVIRLTEANAVGKLARISVPVPAGEHILLLRFEDTSVRRLGKWITGISLVLALGLLVARWRR
ncbi:MAG TPA: hypothetical protein EYH31_04305 [Anaerolineae bacterium]|nr:hypothetical protein [Anaerolineae bacterium]